MRIDAQQHFWLYEVNNESLHLDEMSRSKRNFLPNDISQTLKDCGFDGIVAVQIAQSHRETEFLVELSHVYKVIKGIVGWVDLCSTDIEDYLVHFSKYSVIKGFRHLIDQELDQDFLVRDDFQIGMECLTKFNYTFDLLIQSKHYASALQCIQNNPNQRFMYNFIAMPHMDPKEFENWTCFLDELSKSSNVYCKLSVFGTEEEWGRVKSDTLKSSLSHIVQSFGPKRICFASGWPVSFLERSFEQNIEFMDQNMTFFDEIMKQDFWGNVATDFYRLK